MWFCLFAILWSPLVGEFEDKQKNCPYSIQLKKLSLVPLGFSRSLFVRKAPVCFCFDLLQLYKEVDYHLAGTDEFINLDLSYRGVTYKQNTQKPQ
ncbi:hypothetical protein EFO33_03890 [Lactococcus cremoris]|nr:hypothetical protein [Lactococcus cremoris]MCT4428216.1 hypothetical protein [Lactococcus cremoris]